MVGCCCHYYRSCRCCVLLFSLLSSVAPIYQFLGGKKKFKIFLGGQNNFFGGAKNFFRRYAKCRVSAPPIEVNSCTIRLQNLICMYILKIESIKPRKFIIFWKSWGRWPPAPSIGVTICHCCRCRCRCRCCLCYHSCRRRCS